MRLKKFDTFNESWYSVAARMVNSTPSKDRIMDFSKPSNNDFRVPSAKIIYPDNAIIEFVIQENIYSDIETYKLLEPKMAMNGDRRCYSTALMYYTLFGSGLQFDNFEEYTLVRGYLNKADVNEHTFDGYIVGDNGFYETGIRLSTKEAGNYVYSPLDDGLIQILTSNKDTFHYLRKNVSVGKKLLYKVKDHILDDNEIDLRTEIGGVPAVLILYSNIAFNWDYKQAEACKAILNYAGLASFRGINIASIKGFSDLGELFYV
jgi:hypothetical protein